VKTTTNIFQVKQTLNLICVFTAAKLLYAASSAAAESHRIARNEAAKRAARGAEEVAAYKRQLWFETHARHSFYESADGKISLRARNDGNTFAAPMAKTAPVSTLEPEGINPRLGGTKFGRIESLPATAPYRRGAT
jgi:hypothetical protein